MPKKLLRLILPHSVKHGQLRAAVTVMKHILLDYGYLRSFKENACVDRMGSPIPWFAYPTIDYLAQMDFREKSVFEWGSGYSTIFWSQRAASVISVETNPAWRSKLLQMVGTNTTILVSSNELTEYIGQIDRFSGFDVIIIDGLGESRFRCAQIAPRKLNKGGMIILDNSDLWPQSARELRNQGLIQVDFTGLAPLNVHFQTTSVFFSRDFSFQPLDDLQPRKSVAQPADPYATESIDF
jgi:hypothetical protein